MTVMDTMPLASLKDYILWVCEAKLAMTATETRKYTKLYEKLARIEFVWIHPRDENRAADGLCLRKDFSYEMGEYIDSDEILPKCTVFEMIAGLAYRCEHQIMRNLSYGDRSKKWFYEMLENLGLLDFDNKSWDSESEDQVFNIVHDFLYRKYRVDGSGGGLFPIKRRSLNQKTEEIWVQCMAYLNENYVHEDDNELELYRNYKR